MTNVAIVCHDYKLSGANMSLLDWVKENDKTKYNIILIFPHNDTKTISICKEYNINYIIGHYYVPIKRLNKVNFQRNVRDKVKRILSILINPFSKFILIKKLKKIDVKLIHSNSLSTTVGIEIANKMRVPHIWHAREFMEEDHQISYCIPSKKIKEYYQSSYVIFISDAVKAKYEKAFRNEKQFIIYNKIQYESNYTKNRKFMEDGICNIAIIGTLQENKGHIDAIRAIEKLNEKKVKTKLFIVGEGNDKEKLERYVKNQSITNIVFCGHLDNVTEFRKNVDIALVCSRNEALGRVTIEGMYYENFVIGANAGCTSIIIKSNYNGLLYEVGNSFDLSSKISWIIDNKEKYYNIIKNAKQYSLETFYNTKYHEKIFDIYEKIISNEEGKNE